jgi:hypothetical protein
VRTGGDRLAEVQQPGCPGEDPAGIAGAGVEVPGGALRVAGQQCPGVGQHDRVIFGVNHLEFGTMLQAPGRFVRAARRSPG